MMRVTETGDPRLEALFGAAEPRELGVRPVVGLPKPGPSPWLIAAFALFGALLLFWILESRRGVQPQSSVRERAADARGYAAEPPPLYIPPAPATQPQVLVPPQPAAPILLPQQSSRPAILPAPEPAPAYYPPQPMPGPMPEPPQPQRSASGPALVIDTTAPAGQPGASQGGAVAAASLGGSSWGGRVRASGLANRSTTVPQGVLIPAVLETAFDSNRPGLARAIVSRDVRGFDGTKVLVPRGSRLIGEYGSDVSPGQNRALISWTRLIRPDGVTIALDSPSVDTLGRGGVRASVNTHFWEQFGSALLRSTVDIGTGLATRAATGPVIVAMPGAVQGSVPQQTTRYVPTLRVPAGKSISIFVARDLEFPEGSGR